MASIRWSFKACLFLLSSLLMIDNVYSWASTDTITWGGSVMRHGYQDNHNMDPAVVGSAQFGQLFRTFLPGSYTNKRTGKNLGPEQIYSQPLVYTIGDTQYVFVATTCNNIYKLNAKTGAIVASRSLHIPFLTTDLDGCVDINPYVGVIGTGVIDPNTGIWYLIAKTYADQNTSTYGRLNGRQYFHGINTGDLTDAFTPTSIEGTVFRNNPNRMWSSGDQNQRTALLQVGNYIYAGAASHCVQYNFTGAILGFDARTGSIVEAFATERGPEPNTVRGGGVWMSGGGLSYDGAGSMFFATGNGYASQLSGTPLQGKNPPSTLALEEAAVNAKINDDGTLSVIDFFMPWEKQALDGADKDLGTTPLELLPTSTFTCPNVKRMGVVTGKSGKTYFLNADNLGGYRMGPNKLDAVPQVTQNENSVYSGAGVMPLDGGYIYISVIQYQTHVFKFSCDSNGNPAFTLVANSPEKNANILGTGHGTTTSLNGQSGTGLLWVSDVEGLNLRIYNAVPVNGFLTLVNAFNINGVAKFSRPVFGDGTVYLGTTQGWFYGFGAPVNLPLNCSSPYVFPTTPVNGTSSPLTITCEANIATTVTAAALVGNPNFAYSGMPTLPLQLAAGSTFSFTATFNPKSVGPLSSDIKLNTTNGVANYAITTPITLKGTANSVAPLLGIAPNTVSFNTIVGNEAGGVTQSSIFNNLGDSTLSITSILYSQRSETGPWETPVITDNGVQVGPFTLTQVPTSIPGASSATVNINYNPSVAASDQLFLRVNSDGGSRLLDIFATAGTYPKALVEFEKYDDSGWIAYTGDNVFDFGNVTEGNTRTLRMRVTNVGGSSAVPLSITVSKPPYGVPGIVAAVNNIDLAEGTLLLAGQNATAALYCSVPKSPVNMPAYTGNATWTMNTGDPNLGKLSIPFLCNAVTAQLGPLYPGNQSAVYGWVGCFLDNNPRRQLSYSPWGANPNNENGLCITACAAKGYIFAATEYMQQCWCGNKIPNQITNNEDCNFPCIGNANQTCGGNGVLEAHARMSVFANQSIFDGNVTAVPYVPPPPPDVVNSTGNYNFIGCYSDPPGRKVLSAQTLAADSTTIESCATTCSAYSYFGVEYGRECYCGNSLASGSTLTATSSCSMVCPGNVSQYCGNGGKMSVYMLNGTLSSPAPTSSSLGTGTATTSSSNTYTATQTVSSVGTYNYVGCYNETHDRRALLGSTTSSNKGMTVEHCASFCSGYSYFGIEYAQECFCANSIYSNSILQPTGAGCSMVCSGNNYQWCGGPDYLSVYYSNATISSSAPTTPAGAGTDTTPSNNAPGSGTTINEPATVPSVGNFTSMGCYTEATNGRALTSLSTNNNTGMTVEYCAAYCASFTYFGVEFAQECYCGNILRAGSVPATTGCSMACSGDSTEYCGGPGKLNLYQRNTTGSESIPAVESAAIDPVTVPSYGPYTHIGCYTEGTSSRALTGNTTNTDTLTVGMCGAIAAANNWIYFGVEYGRECYMGNVTQSGALLAGSTGSAAGSGQTDCNMVCKGNSSEYCGAGSRLNMYMLNPKGTRASTLGSAPYSSSGLSISSSTSSVIPSTTSSLPASSSPSSTPTSLSSSVASSSSSGSSASSSSTSLLTSTSSSASLPGLTSSSFASLSSFANSSSTISSSSSSSSSVTYLSTSNSSSASSMGSTSSSSTSPSASASSSATISSSPGSSDSSSSSSSATPLLSSSSSASLSGLTTSSASPTSSASSSFIISSSSGSSNSSSSLSPSTSTSGLSSASSSSLPFSLFTSSSPSSSSFAITSGSSSSSTSSSSTPSSSISSTSSSSPGLSTSSSSAALQGSSSSPSSTPSPSLSSSSSSSTSLSTTRVSSPSISQSTTSTTIQSAMPTPSGFNYTYQGCWTEGKTGRALAALYTVNQTGMSIEYCASFCSGYKWFGVEYGSECYCGPYPTNSATNTSVPESDCSMPCSGNTAQKCGAGNRLSMYFSSDSTKSGFVTAPPAPVIVLGNANYTFYNCVNEPASGRALPTLAAANSSMTVDMCLLLAQRGDRSGKSYIWAGVEYGRECWVGQSVQGGAPVNSTGGARDCSMTCLGNPSEYCGRGGKLSMYSRNGTVS